MAEKPKKKLLDGTLVDVDIAAKTAECDADGNTISTTYAKKTEVVDLSSSQTITGDKHFNGLSTQIDRLYLGTKGDDQLPIIEVYNNRPAVTYNLVLPDKNIGSYTIATTDQIPDVTNYVTFDGNEEILGNKTFTGTLKAKNLSVASPDADTGPRIKVYNQVDEYYVNMPESSGTIALTSQIPTASDCGVRSTQIFQGAGDISGQYHQYGSWSTKINIVSQGYKLLVFYIDISNYEFPFCAYVPSSSFSNMIYCACASHDGSLTVIKIVYSDSNFTASVDKGTGILRNVNIYAYK